MKQKLIEAECNCHTCKYRLRTTMFSVTWN